ncbi:transmembrane protein, putative [Rhizoctonia solani AG-3 Rhs1AP]|uniref:Transmembrane protein, putative n=1 Tax=Rhizoctonia solani AG-3 Rhs1AP TaxID=1086054 RepID=X8IYG1_9AGAM|nr:transmembrane protein, putative [Rhizoctonia solani AG-3 Rhs1AP]
MLAFTRLTSILLFVLSLGFLVSALPTAVDSKALAARHESTALVGLIADLEVNVKAHATAILSVNALVDVVAKVDLLVADVTACAHAVLAIGANIDIDASVKADIVVKVAAIITVIVNLCVQLVAKFGILVVVGLLAKIDLCLQLLIVNLGVCVEGIIALVAEIVVKLGVSVLAHVHLGLCINVLGLVTLSL